MNHPLRSTLALLPGIFLATGCATKTPEKISNRTFPGKFHGQYDVVFDSSQKVLVQVPTTWFLKEPMPGPKTPSGKLPPNSVQPGMDQPRVVEILGQPESSSSRVYTYYVR